jgi:mitochondrial fission protein ELM1
MALLAQRILGGLTPARWSRTRPPATESAPDRILLGIKPGFEDKGLPPVKIYLGSERHQFRAERAFLWSVEKHRDPARVYEIYLMRDLRGFSRGFWLTGFTNYRFAIPAFCRFEGRAIYNDADQIYLCDPAELFDLEMGDAGFLSINDRDTSVMLIDCTKMQEVWGESQVRTKSRKQLEANARAKDLWGDLDNQWNARDKEYDPKASKLVHFTTLHTQPWRPFPDQLVYFNNPTASLWPDLESEANRNHFLPFNATRPSRHWSSVALYLTSKKTANFWQPYLAPNPPRNPTSKIEVAELFEHVPDQDVLWVLMRLMKSTDRLILRIEEPWRHGGGRFKRSLGFWLQHLALVSEMAPNTHWQLSYRNHPLNSLEVYEGGPALAGTITHILHRKPGHNAQARSLAEFLASQLGYSCETLKINTSEWAYVVSHLLGRRALEPLPDGTTVLVAAGWLSTRLARAYQRRYPYLRLILLGRKAGPVPVHGGVLVQCSHYDLPPDPKRIETLIPLNAGQASPCADTQAYASWQSADHKIALLLGGPTKSYAYQDEDITELGQHIASLQTRKNSSVLIVGSRRSGALVKQVAQQISEPVVAYEWEASDPNNPYALALKEADQLVVTGDSESMLSDAVAQGREFQIFFKPHPPVRWFDRISDWIGRRAIAPTYNRRGSIRPQQGLQYLCARCIERAWILPPRNLIRLHESLYREGFAIPWDEAHSRETRLFTAPAVLKETSEMIIQQLKLKKEPSD